MQYTSPAVQSASPASFPPFQDELLTVSEVAALLKCKESSIYNLTRKRGQLRYDNPIPVLRLPCGLRSKKSSIVAWLDSQEQSGGVQ
jgi:predicted DNA-binding transcriptional regulator AlpA